MIDINKASKIQEKEIRSQLDRMEMVEALKYTNDIPALFAKSKVFKLSEFNDFFAGRWYEWKANVVKDEVKSLEGAYFEPDMLRFAIQHREAQISPEDGAYFYQQMGEHMQRSEMGGRSARFRASTDGTGQPSTDDTTPEELRDIARGTLDEWDGFMNDTWSQILDTQMMSDYKSKMSEVQEEVRRIVALAKQGAVGPEFLLIALAKVNSMRNGVLMTWLGKKAFRVNESLSKIVNDLHTLNVTSDPRYAGELQLAQSKTREGSFNLNLLTTDMQKVMNDMASVVEQVHGMISEINRTRREIITKVSAS